MNEIVLTSFCQVVTDKEKEKIRKSLMEKFDMEILKKTLPRLFPDTVVQEVKCEVEDVSL